MKANNLRKLRKLHWGIMCDISDIIMAHNIIDVDEAHILLDHTDNGKLLTIYKDTGKLFNASIVYEERSTGEIVQHQLELLSIREQAKLLDFLLNKLNI